jgi:uncharacterized DUF497 family protein
VCDGFEWDRAKSDDCYERREFDFAAAIRIFRGEYLERFDMEHSDEEDCWIVTGFLCDVLIDVIYTWRGDRRRIISAFESDEESIAKYEEAYGNQE